MTPSFSFYKKTMRIRSLKTKGYRGFRLRQIETLCYTPRSKTQIILGTNGCGKSSLLKELSPLAANHQDYTKPGYKIITYEHMGKEYVLESIFDENGRRYLFKVDGENLNKGYTLTVYTELVKEHFGYTPEIHKLMTGQTRFHAMSVNERRQLFMKLGDTDYTYAYKYYQKLKERIRDLQGALRQQQNRLAEETQKCLTQKDEVRLRENVSENQHILQMLVNARIQAEQDVSGFYRTAQKLDQDIETDLRKLENIGANDAVLKCFTLGELLDEQQFDLQVKVKTQRDFLTYHCDKVLLLQKDLERAKQSSAQSVTVLQSEIDVLEKEIASLTKTLYLPIHFEDAVIALNSYDSVSLALNETLDGIVNAPKHSYTQEAYARLSDELKRLAVVKENAVNARDKIISGIQHLEAHRDKGEVSCPNCHFSWIPNYSDQAYAKLLQDRETAGAGIEALLKQEEKLKEISENYDRYFGHLRELNQYSKTFTTLAPFWQYLKTSAFANEASESPISAVRKLGIDLRTLVKIQSLKTRLNALKKDFDIASASSTLDESKIQKTIDEENARIYAIQEILKRAEEAQRETTYLLSLRTSLTQAANRVVSNYQERNACYQKVFEKQYLSIVDEMIHQVRLEISHYERQLSQVEIQKALVKDTQKQINTIEHKLSLLKPAEKALSPKEGLIAKGMLRFIQHFTEEMNRFIAKFWLYPLKVLTPSLTSDEVDLDYSFPVKVNNDTRITEDVAKTSSGMKEIIDLAFVATSMSYLKLSNSPIYLDEFAVGFDAAHRQMAYQAIDYLISSKNYSQVFIVSHYQDGYNALTDADISVLCDANIQLPTHLAYNKVIKFNTEGTDNEFE